MRSMHDLATFTLSHLQRLQCDRSLGERWRASGRCFVPSLPELQTVDGNDELAQRTVPPGGVFGEGHTTMGKPSVTSQLKITAFPAAAMWLSLVVAGDAFLLPSPAPCLVLQHTPPEI